MWPSVRTQSGVDRILFLISAVSALVFLSTASPTVSVAAAKVPHSRARRAVSKQLPAAVRQPTTAEELKQQSEVLAGLQVSLSALEKKTVDFNAAIQRRMNQLSAEFADFHKQTQQMLKQTNQRIDSTQRLVQSIVLLFVLSLGGLLYLVLQLPRLEHNPVKWEGKVPDMTPDEEGIAAWQSGEPANSSARKLDIGPDTHSSVPALIDGDLSGRIAEVHSRLRTA
jgi:hypothetical protein